MRVKWLFVGLTLVAAIGMVGFGVVHKFHKRSNLSYAFMDPPPSLDLSQFDYWGDSEADSPLNIEKSDMRMLYAGHPGSRREEDFVCFLKTVFNQVETGDYKTYTDEQGESYDAVILDYDGEPLEAPQPVRFIYSSNTEYSKATVTVGSAGAELCMLKGWRTGYY